MLKWLKWLKLLKLLNILRFLFSNEWVDFPQMLSFKKSTVIKKLVSLYRRLIQIYYV